MSSPANKVQLGLCLCFSVTSSFWLSRAAAEESLSPVSAVSSVAAMSTVNDNRGAGQDRLEWNGTHFVNLAEKGIMVGYLRSFSKNGAIKATSTWSGQLVLGLSGNPAVIKSDKDCKLKDQSTCVSDEVANPIDFSIDDNHLDIANKMKALNNTYVVIKFEKVRFYNSLMYDHRTFVVDVMPFGTETPNIACPKVDIGWIRDQLSTDEGTLNGHLIKISSRGTALKTWEVLFEERYAVKSGNFQANAFKSLSLSDSNLLPCMVASLKSKKAVGLNYVREWPLINYPSESRNFITDLAPSSSETAP